MIKGLKPVLAEAGKIKLGGLGPEITSRKGKKFRPPVKYDEFVITTTQRDTSGDLIRDVNLTKALKNGYDKLLQIPILLHSDDVEEVFPSCYACYQGQQLHCRGDGETATRWQITKDGKRSGDTESIKCPCDKLEAKKCKPHATLNCMIRADRRAVAGAVHKWRTTSWNSIRRTLASLHQIKGLFGTLRNIPLRLKLDKIKVTPKGERPRTVFCAYVECAAEDFASIQQRALTSARVIAETRALSQGTPPPPGYKDVIDIPASNAETPAEQSRVAAEFHPPLSYDPETGEILENGSPAPQNEPPDPEPDGEESSGDAHEGATPVDQSVPRDDPARAVIIDLLVDLTAIKLKNTGASPDDNDWEDRHREKKIRLWASVCQGILGYIPEDEPEVTRSDCDKMRRYVKHMRRNALLEKLTRARLTADGVDADDDAWSESFKSVRYDYWETLCEKVVGAPVGYDQGLDEDLLDELTNAIDAMHEKISPSAPPEEDDGKKRSTSKEGGRKASKRRSSKKT